jgi:glycosyltransferase involved in cell wall biosynthesis
VERLRLARKWRFDATALKRLIEYIRMHDIRILHAHGTSWVIAAVTSLFPPCPAVIWHDHFGEYAIHERPAWLYRLLTHRFRAVVAVNQPLAEWARGRLRVPAERVWYIPNFVCEPPPTGSLPDLPGTAGARIVCVANFRPQKDHPTLLRAMAVVTKHLPTAHLLLVGFPSEPRYLEHVRCLITRLGLEGHVSVLGPRQDVTSILAACDIGVLSSVSEGLPLALIEYGMAGLPAVATRIGQCAEVLEEGRSGILVGPQAPDALAEALLRLLSSPDLRTSCGERFRCRARQMYGQAPVLEQICRVYDTVLA